MRWKLFVALFVVLLVPMAAQAQNINPRVVEFTVSPDHSAVSSYEVAYFLTGATVPVQAPIDIGKCTPDANGLCTAVPINTQPIPFGLYSAKVRAKAPDPATPGVYVYSEWSDPSNPFQRAPGKPGKPIPK